MGTWAGAIVQTRKGRRLADLVEAHRVVIEDESFPWTLIEAKVGLGSLGPPPFAEAISRELDGAVIAFFVQTTASVEEIEHWDRGKLVRKLEYSGDEGGWILQEGTAQTWEPDFFFAKGEGTKEGEEWPLNLDDEITNENIVRYEEARAKGDASSIMDLLHGGSVWPIRRLCEQFGVDPEKPGGRYSPPTNWKPRIILAVGILFLLGMFLLGALTSS